MNKFNYIFALGHKPTLSILEIRSVFKKLNSEFKILDVSKEVLVIETNYEIKNPQEFLDRLGGTVKLVIGYSSFAISNSLLVIGNLEKVLMKELTSENLLKNFFAQTKSKIPFGISMYFLESFSRDVKDSYFRKIMSFGLNIKKQFKSKEISSRFVVSRDRKNALSSVVVYKNKLIQKGAEIVLVVSKNKIYIGKTLAVQDFESYNKRDYGRPCRMIETGMMPPKLAQIMINLATSHWSLNISNKTILDPFCGAGTILQEAVLLGYDVIGSDISDRMVECAKRNTRWLKDTYHLSNITYQIFKADAREISKFLKPNSIDAIVTESSLGPLYSTIPSEEQIKKTFSELSELYIKAFSEFKKVLKKDGKIAITFPCYKKNNIQHYSTYNIQNYIFLDILDKIRRLGYNVENPIQGIKSNLLEITNRNSMIYDRPDHIVAREIIIFSRI